LAIDLAFDIEQGVDATDRVQCDRRDDGRCLALRFSPGAGSQIGQDEEPAAGVDPARRFQNQARLASLFIKLVVSAIRIGLEDTGISLQVALGVLAGAITRVIEHCRRRRRAAKRPIVAHIGP
jgi:hypothetical protein